MLALGLRAGLSTWLAIVWMVVDPYFPRTGMALVETYGRLIPSRTMLGRSLLDVWLRWDAVHYMNIAIDGYGSVGKAETNYMPLYPYLVHFVKSISGQGEILSGLLISTIAGILAFIFFYKLVLFVFEAEELAKWTILVWGLYPTSFFIFAPYTEALFSCLALGSLYLLYKEKWILAGALATLAGVTRVQGYLLIFPMIALLLGKGRRGIREPMTLQSAAGIAFIPVSFLIYYSWRGSFGLAFLTDSFNQYSKIIFTDPIRGYLHAIWFAITTHDYISITEAISVSLFWGLTIGMMIHKRFRTKYPLISYTIANLALFSSKQVLFASPLQSVNRYVISLFPAFILLADLVLQMPDKRRKIYLLVNLIGYMVAATFYSLWIFIG